MKKKNPWNPDYRTVLSQIQALDLQIDKLSKQIQEVKRTFKESPAEDPIVEEICLDEVEANKAALEMMRNICLEAMLDVDPQGEA